MFPKFVVKKEITHENYTDVLTTNVPLINSTTPLYTTVQKKKPTLEILKEYLLHYLFEINFLDS